MKRYVGIYYYRGVYRNKFVDATDPKQAIKKLRIKNLIDLQEVDPITNKVIRGGGSKL